MSTESRSVDIVYDMRSQDWHYRIVHRAVKTSYGTVLEI